MELKYLQPGKSLFLDDAACIGCGKCVEVCPHAVFAFAAKKAFIETRDTCMECGACAQNCPTSAIRVKSGVGCAWAVINGIIKGGEPSCDCGSDKNSCC